MAKRIQGLAARIVDHHGGAADGLWRDVADGEELLRSLMGLPGFGRQKAQIFLVLPGKRLGVRPPGWREAAGPYGEEGVFLSVADVTDEESLAKVRAAKREAKQAAKEKLGRSCCGWWSVLTGCVDRVGVGASVRAHPSPMMYCRIRYPGAVLHRLSSLEMCLVVDPGTRRRCRP